LTSGKPLINHSPRRAKFSVEDLFDLPQMLDFFGLAHFHGTILCFPGIDRMLADSLFPDTWVPAWCQVLASCQRVSMLSRVRFFVSGKRSQIYANDAPQMNA
jgi:hypothetical protein